MKTLCWSLLLLVSTAASATERLPDALAPYAGKPIVLDFWASWCGPCSESFPWLNAMHARYGDSVTIVGVDVDAQPADAKAFLKRHAPAFAIVNDPDGKIAAAYRIQGMPSTVILDAQGHVVHQHAGFHNNRVAEYESAIRTAAGGSRP